MACGPVHVGKFSIAFHPWDEPFERIAKATLKKSYRSLTSMIKEMVKLNETNATTQNGVRMWIEKVSRIAHHGKGTRGPVEMVLDFSVVAVGCAHLGIAAPARIRQELDQIVSTVRNQNV